MTERAEAAIDCVGGQYLYARTYTAPNHDIVASACLAKGRGAARLAEAAEQSIRDLCFDVMDARFAMGGDWRWTPSGPAARPFVHRSRHADERQFTGWLVQEAASFRLEKGDLVRAYVANIGDESAVAVLAHHLVADALSVRFLLERILRLADGAPAAPAAEPFASYARTVREAYLSDERDIQLAALLEQNARLPPSPRRFDLAPYSGFDVSTTRLPGIAPALRGLLRDRFDAFLGDGAAALAALAVLGPGGGRWWLMASGRTETRESRRFSGSFGFLACPSLVITDLSRTETRDDRIRAFVESGREAHAAALTLGSVLYAPWQDRETASSRAARQALWPSLYVNYYGDAGGLRANAAVRPLPLAQTFSSRNGRIYQVGVTLRLAGDDIQIEVASKRSGETAAATGQRIAELFHHLLQTTDKERRHALV